MKIEQDWAHRVTFALIFCLCVSFVCVFFRLICEHVVHLITGPQPNPFFFSVSPRIAGNQTDFTQETSHFRTLMYLFYFKNLLMMSGPTENARVKFLKNKFYSFSREL